MGYFDRRVICPGWTGGFGPAPIKAEDFGDVPALRKRLGPAAMLGKTGARLKAMLDEAEKEQKEGK